MRLKPNEIGSCWNHQMSRMRSLRNLGFIPRSILDIGAYHGSWSEVMWHIWPESQYHLIEANPDCEEKLKNTGFKYDIALLSNEEKSIIYHKCQTGSGEGNSIYREKTNYPFEATTTIAKSLPQVVGEDSIYDLIKIDAQGAELGIIIGGYEIINRAMIVQVECQIQSYNDGAPLAAEVIEYMARPGLGFRLYDIGEYHYNSRNMLIQADFIFARKDCGLFDLKILT